MLPVVKDWSRAGWGTWRGRKKIGHAGKLMGELGSCTGSLQELSGTGRLRNWVLSWEFMKVGWEVGNRGWVGWGQHTKDKFHNCESFISSNTLKIST